MSSDVSFDEDRTITTNVEDDKRMTNPRSSDNASSVIVTDDTKADAAVTATTAAADDDDNDSASIDAILRAHSLLLTPSLPSTSSTTASGWLASTSSLLSSTSFLSDLHDPLGDLELLRRLALQRVRFDDNIGLGMQIALAELEGRLDAREMKRDYLEQIEIKQRKGGEEGERRRIGEVGGWSDGYGGKEREDAIAKKKRLNTGSTSERNNARASSSGGDGRPKRLSRTTSLMVATSQRDSRAFFLSLHHDSIGVTTPSPFSSTSSLIGVPPSSSAPAPPAELVVAPSHDRFGSLLESSRSAGTRLQFTKLSKRTTAAAKTSRNSRQASIAKACEDGELQDNDNTDQKEKVKVKEYIDENDGGGGGGGGSTSASLAPLEPWFGRASGVSISLSSNLSLRTLSPPIVPSASSSSTHLPLTSNDASYLTGSQSSRTFESSASSLSIKSGIPPLHPHSSSAMSLSSAAIVPNSKDGTAPTINKVLHSSSSTSEQPLRWGGGGSGVINTHPLVSSLSTASSAVELASPHHNVMSVSIRESSTDIDSLPMSMISTKDIAHSALVSSSLPTRIDENRVVAPARSRRANRSSGTNIGIIVGVNPPIPSSGFGYRDRDIITSYASVNSDEASGSSQIAPYNPARGSSHLSLHTASPAFRSARSAPADGQLRAAIYKADRMGIDSADFRRTIVGPLVQSSSVDTSLIADNSRTAASSAAAAIALDALAHAHLEHRSLSSVLAGGRTMVSAGYGPLQTQLRSGSDTPRKVDGGPGRYFMGGHSVLPSADAADSSALPAVHIAAPHYGPSGTANKVERFLHGRVVGNDTLDQSSPWKYERKKKVVIALGTPIMDGVVSRSALVMGAPVAPHHLAPGSYSLASFPDLCPGSAIGSMSVGSSANHSDWLEVERFDRPVARRLRDDAGEVARRIDDPTFKGDEIIRHDEVGSAAEEARRKHVNAKMNARAYRAISRVPTSSLKALSATINKPQVLGYISTSMNADRRRQNTLRKAEIATLKRVTTIKQLRMNGMQIVSPTHDDGDDDDDSEGTHKRSPSVLPTVVLAVLASLPVPPPSGRDRSLPSLASVATLARAVELTNVSIAPMKSTSSSLSAPSMFGQESAPTILTPAEAARESAIAKAEAALMLLTTSVLMPPPPAPVLPALLSISATTKSSVNISLYRDSISQFDQRNRRHRRETTSVTNADHRWDVFNNHRAITKIAYQHRVLKLAQDESALNQRLSHRHNVNRWFMIIALTYRMTTWFHALTDRRTSLLANREMQSAAVVIQRIWRAYDRRMQRVRRSSSLRILTRTFKMLIFRRRVLRRIRARKTLVTFFRDMWNVAEKERVDGAAAHARDVAMGLAPSAAQIAASGARRGSVSAPRPGPMVRARSILPTAASANSGGSAFRRGTVDVVAVIRHFKAQIKIIQRYVRQFQLGVRAQIQSLILQWNAVYDRQRRLHHTNAGGGVTIGHMKGISASGKGQGLTTNVAIAVATAMVAAAAVTATLTATTSAAATTPTSSKGGAKKKTSRVAAVASSAAHAPSSAPSPPSPRSAKILADRAEDEEDARTAAEEDDVVPMDLNASSSSASPVPSRPNARGGTMGTVMEESSNAASKPHHGSSPSLGRMSSSLGGAVPTPQKSRRTDSIGGSNAAGGPLSPSGGGPTMNGSYTWDHPFTDDEKRVILMRDWRERRIAFVKAHTKYVNGENAYVREQCRGLTAARRLLNDDSDVVGNGDDNSEESRARQSASRQYRVLHPSRPIFKYVLPHAVIIRLIKQASYKRQQTQARARVEQHASGTT